jgi:hypothetical protein
MVSRIGVSEEHFLQEYQTADVREPKEEVVAGTPAVAKRSG